MMREGFLPGAERRGRASTTPGDRDEIRAWFIGNLIDNWFIKAVELHIDDHEVLVIGELAPLELEDKALSATAEAARIERFREDTRERRIEIAERAEQRFDRKVSWGVTIGSTTRMFTTTSIPVMTRLHMAQRRTLDTLVDAGVARSRSEALAWCVELVGQNEQDWIERLRSALNAVEQERASGPASSTS